MLTSPRPSHVWRDLSSSCYEISAAAAPIFQLPVFSIACKANADSFWMGADTPRCSPASHQPAVDAPHLSQTLKIQYIRESCTGGRVCSLAFSCFTADFFPDIYLKLQLSLVEFLAALVIFNNCVFRSSSPEGEVEIDKYLKNLWHQ